MRIFSRVPAIAALVSIPLLFASCGDGGGGGTGPDQEPVEVLASFELTVPDSISEGEAFSLTITAVGSRGTKPLISYSGSVTLSTTLGTVTPASLAVSNGTGSGQVTLSTPGQQTLTASGGGRTGSLGVEVTDLPDPPIAGDPNATLEEVLRDSLFKPRAEDYSSDHPELAGLYVSHNTVLMAFHVGTTVRQANDLLTPLGAELVGGIQGVPGQTASILMTRLRTTTHQEMEATLATLKASQLVLDAAQDVLLGPDALPPSEKDHPAGWSWEYASEPNRHLWSVRVPQMWNFNRALEKQGRGTTIGIVDLGFYQHEDLIFENFGLPIDDFHGTVIAGIIGATYENDLGIEGIYPFIRDTNPLGEMVTLAIPMGLAGPGGSVLDRLTSVGQLMSEGIDFFTHQRPDLRVINASLGYNWVKHGVDPSSTEAVNLANSQGALLAQELQGIVFPPLIVVSAGNDNGADARFNSPMTNAALVQNVFNILVVENVEWDGAKFSRYQTSNVGGHISAPGSFVFSTNVGPDGYDNQTGTELHVGTSFSAGLVSGLAAYLLAVDKDLNPAQVKKVLLDNTVPTGGGSQPMLDAWAAVLGIDELRGEDRILEMMVDIDDGTVDGNQRVDYDSLTFPDLDSLDVDGDGGLGDGKVDMSDFRVWRDWYLKIWEPGSVQFDGRDDHPKMDVNDNGVTEDDAGESHYPRGDFNGDGILSLEDSVWVLGAVQDSLSDLDVFKVVFDDPNYDKDDLDTLVHSIDIRVDASSLFELMGVSSVEVSILDGGGPPPPAYYPTIQSRTILPEDPEQVFTLRHNPIGYRCEIDIEHPAWGTDNIAFGTDAVQVGKELGSDVSVRPIWGMEYSPNATYISTCEDPGALDAVPIVLGDWGIEPGDIIVIDQEGFFLVDDSTQSEQMQGLFSKSSEVIKEYIDLPGDTEGAPPKKLVRRTVTGAIEAGKDVFTPPPGSCGTVVADITEDFSITPHVVFQVPDSATHLFLAPRASRYGDNGQDPEDPLEVSITAIYIPEWTNRIQRVSRER